jgi:hypothetical protein
VADYTMILSRRLVEVSESSIEPVLIHAGHRPAEAVDVEFPVEDLSGQCSASVLAQTIERLSRNVNMQVVVLLEYSGYGYVKRGAPLWLVRGLRQVCGETGLPLITMFHEVSASGPPWTSAFWLSPFQKWIARKLVRLSKAALVNRAGGAAQLREWTSRPSKVTFRPVFSNVGEPDERRPFHERGEYAVVFCGVHEKEALYARSDQLRRILERKNIRRLIDLGTRPRPLPDLGIPIEVEGKQSAEAISRWLDRAQLGFAHRRLDLLTKSGIVAAYLAHGVPPVILPNGTGTHTPALSEGKHYVRFDRAHSRSINWSSTSEKGYGWYQSHAHSRGAAQLILNQLDHVGPST